MELELPIQNRIRYTPLIIRDRVREVGGSWMDI